LQVGAIGSWKGEIDPDGAPHIFELSPANYVVYPDCGSLMCLLEYSVSLNIVDMSSHNKDVTLMLPPKVLSAKL
jgi:hypothetical protein